MRRTKIRYSSAPEKWKRKKWIGVMVHDQHWVQFLQFQGENRKNSPSVDLWLFIRNEMHRFCIIALRCDHLSRIHSIPNAVVHGKRFGIWGFHHSVASLWDSDLVDSSKYRKSVIDSLTNWTYRRLISIVLFEIAFNVPLCFGNAPIWGGRSRKPRRRQDSVLEMKYLENRPNLQHFDVLIIDETPIPAKLCTNL